MEFRLYVDAQFISPYAMSVFVALSEKSIQFEVECIDLDTQENLQAEYTACSLTCRIPTLRHKGLNLSESSAITEYLEEIFPPPVYAATYPRNLVARAKARQVQAWLRSDLLALRKERPTRVIFQEPSDEALSEQAQRDVERLFQVSESLLRENEKTLFDEWSIADTDLALMLNRLLANGDKIPARLAEYVKYQWQRPSVQAWIAHGNKDHQALV